MNHVTIIGTGPAGLTAAIYTARAGLKPIVYAGNQHGGQLTTTTEVENFPGFENGIMGPQLMADMTKQAERVGATIRYEDITGSDFSDPKALKLQVGDNVVETKTVIIATGATAKTLGLPFSMWSQMECHHASITEFRIYPGDHPALMTYNDTGHMPPSMVTSASS